MSLLTILRSGVKIVDTVTKSLQPFVTITQCTGFASDGPQYGASIQRQAIVEYKQQLVKTWSGALVQSRASVIFVDQGFTVNLNDKLILPDGSTGPILDTGGFADAGTGYPIVGEVFLGALSGNSQ